MEAAGRSLAGSRLAFPRGPALTPFTRQEPCRATMLLAAASAGGPPAGDNPTVGNDKDQLSRKRERS